MVKVSVQQAELADEGLVIGAVEVGLLGRVSSALVFASAPAFKHGLERIVHTNASLFGLVEGALNPVADNELIEADLAKSVSTA